MQMLKFVRGENEWRQVSVRSDGSYRIWAQTGNIGKCHENFEAYYKHLKENGWRKVDNSEFYRVKFGIKSEFL